MSTQPRQENAQTWAEKLDFFSSSISLVKKYKKNYGLPYST